VVAKKRGGKKMTSEKNEVEQVKLVVASIFSNFEKVLMKEEKIRDVQEVIEILVEAGLALPKSQREVVTFDFTNSIAAIDVDSLSPNFEDRLLEVLDYLAGPDITSGCFRVRVRTMDSTGTLCYVDNNCKISSLKEASYIADKPVVLLCTSERDDVHDYIVRFPLLKRKTAVAFIQFNFGKRHRTQ